MLEDKNTCLYGTCKAPATMHVIGRDNEPWPCCNDKEHALAIAILKGNAKLELDKETGNVTKAELQVVLRQPIGHIEVKVQA